ncbi:MAG: hypothetical protein JWR26_3117 [Pedosphaera sp.]|nr:hypothetical protein [Pedosphaera sp.]
MLKTFRGLGRGTGLDCGWQKLTPALLHQNVVEEREKAPGCGRVCVCFYQLMQPSVRTATDYFEAAV